MFNPMNYIKTENVEKFRNFMVSNKIIVDSLYGDLSYSDLMRLDSGRRREIISVPSNKFDIENGLVSIVQYLAPAQHVNGFNLCRFASEGCKRSCLAFTGRLACNVDKTYTNKTIALYMYTIQYLTDLLNDLDVMCYTYAKQNKFVYFRLNGLSDIPFHWVIDYNLLRNDISNFLGGYDYTKKPVNDSFVGYDITYSWNEKSTLQIASRFDSVAYVLNKKDVKRLLSEYPNTFVDGDYSDIRPRDNRKHVLLSFKGKKTDNDFVMSYEGLVSLLGLEGVTC